MNLGDALRTAFANLASHKLRSALTMLGMIFGVGAVIAMLSIGAGAEQQALEMIDRLGARNVLVRDVELRDDELEEVRETSPGLSPRNAVAIVDAVPGVRLVCPVDRVPEILQGQASVGLASAAGGQGIPPELPACPHLGGEDDGHRPTGPRCPRVVRAGREPMGRATGREPD